MININNKSWTKLRFSDIQKHLSGSDDETFFLNINQIKFLVKNLLMKYLPLQIHLVAIFFLALEMIKQLRVVLLGRNKKYIRLCMIVLHQFQILM